jgi:ribosome-binding protein aMBF1 (putative translation factor)
VSAVKAKKKSKTVIKFESRPFNRYAWLCFGIRRRTGMVQVELAKALGVSQSWLSKLEAGKLVPKEPQFRRVRRVARKARAGV